jgi:hypothetical protein
MRIDFNVPELDRHNAWRAALMGCLVVCTPCSNSVTNMAAAEFDLRVVAHRRKLVERGVIERW